MNYALFLALMALELILFLGLFFHSRQHVRQGFPRRVSDNPRPETESWERSPRAAIIVPITGNSPEIRGCLESLLNQDYPDYETIFVTRDLKDPATFLVQDLISGRRRTRHVLSGPAASCSQKNHNLLAGLASVGPAVEILVFCDSTHQAPPHLLGSLVRPLIRREAVLTTGFHRIKPGNFGLATLGMLQIVLMLNLLHGFSRIVQPWGGATAVLRSTFEAQDMFRVWSENVIDDLSLGVHLQRAGIRVKSVPSAILTTNLTGQTLDGFITWLTRQLLYPKFLLPGIWAASGVAIFLLAALPLAAALACLGGLLGLALARYSLAGVAFLVSLSAIGVCYRTLVPYHISLWRWLAAFYATPGLTLWCYLKTWGTNTISWRGISYRVAWGGRVRQIIFPGNPTGGGKGPG